MYCSEACRDKDYHQTDLTLFEDQRHVYLTEMVLWESARILDFDRASAQTLISERERRTVFDFDLSNPEAKDYEKTLFKIVNGMSKLPAAGTETFPTLPVMNLYKHFWDITGCNALRFGECGSYGLRDYELGRAVPAFGSLLNHSCYPNLEHLMVEGKIVFVVTRPTKAGEQLFVTYGPNVWADPIDTRKKFLEAYGFECDCVACANDYPLEAGLVRKDRSFVELELPATKNVVQDTISKFKKYCKYINKNFTKAPSYEVNSLEAYIRSLLGSLARKTYNEYREDQAGKLPINESAK